MYEYCIHELGLSEQAALKRIRAGRTARRFPKVFAALADGRLHLSGVILLTPYLTSGNADELLGAAAHRTKAEIEHLLAQRFPRPDVPAGLQAIASLPSLTSHPELSPGTVKAATSGEQLVPGTVETQGPTPVGTVTEQLSPGTVGTQFPKVKPLSPERFALQLTIDQRTHDKLRYVQSLLSHQVPSGDLATLLERALDCYIHQLEKQKFAATERPRTGPQRKATAKRHIPAHVKRAVWERDRGQCTFVSETGHRCSARRFLEFDHEDPVARGGQATVERMRLRCRAHNQYEAECAFGVDFMVDKRETARRASKRASSAAAELAHAAAADRAQAAAAERAQAAAAERARAAEIERDVMAALRTLGFRADESRRATTFSETLAGAPLEERVRLALSYFRPRVYSHTPAAPTLGRAP